MKDLNWRIVQNSMFKQFISLLLKPRKKKKLSIAIGPSNMTGQATRWVAALEEKFEAVSGSVYELEREHSVGWDTSKSTLITSEMWKAKKSAELRIKKIAETSTHVLFEGGLPLSGRDFGPLFVNDARYLEKHDVKVGLVLHGSDIRIPSVHKESNGAESPFSISDEWVLALELKTTRLHETIKKFPDLTKFITTTDLFDFVQDGIWLPVSVDLSELVNSREPFSSSTIRILHLPSNRRTKGSDYLDFVMNENFNNDRFEYRSITGLTRKQVIEQLNWSDIVLDQFGVGGYGVLACEAMAMQRIVVARLNPSVERNQPDLPVLNLSFSNLVDGIHQLTSDIEQANIRANLGREYAVTHHNGEKSSEIIGKFLGLESSGRG